MVYSGKGLQLMLLGVLQTAAVKPILGKYYREPTKSGPLPIHLLEPLIRSFQEDHFVSDEGDIVFYQKDPSI